MMPTDLRGKSFHRWIILSLPFKDKKGKRKVLVRCICGTEKELSFYVVCAGQTKSCGCFRKESGKTANFLHGISKTRFAGIFYGMKNRCTNPKNLAFRYYGGKGIKISWASVSEFKKDMLSSYLEAIKKFGEKNVSLDRIDSNKDYCLSNCRWTTWDVQGANKKSTRIFKINGQRLNLNQISKKFSIKRSTLNTRLCRGWSIQRILSTQVTPLKRINKSLKEEIISKLKTGGKQSVLARQYSIDQSALSRWLSATKKIPVATLIRR